MVWILAACTIFGGIAAIWFFWDKIVSCFRQPPPKMPELQVDRQLADEIALTKHLETQGERLFWGDKSKEDYYLQLGDYQRITWTDKENKTWLLCAVYGGDLPLRTQFSSDQIEQRRKDRTAKNK